MNSIEKVAFDRYLSDQSLPERKRMNASNYIDWANLGAREAQRWIPLEEELPPSGFECLMQNDKWIHLDFNPKGIRVGYHCDLIGYVTAYFCGQHDCYMTRTSDEDDETFELSKAEDQIPTHWRPYERN